MSGPLGIDLTAVASLRSGTTLDAATRSKFEGSRVSGTVLYRLWRAGDKCLEAAKNRRNASVLYKFQLDGDAPEESADFDPTSRKITDVAQAAVVMGRLYAIARNDGFSPVVVVNEGDAPRYAAVLARWGTAVSDGEGPFTTANFTWRLASDGELPSALTAIRTSQLREEDAGLRLGVTLASLAAAEVYAEADLLARTRSEVTRVASNARKLLTSAASNGLECCELFTVDVPADEDPIEEKDCAALAYLFVLAVESGCAPLLVVDCGHDGGELEDGPSDIGLLVRWSKDKSTNRVFEGEDGYWRLIKADERRQWLPRFESWLDRARKDPILSIIRLGVDPKDLVAATISGPPERARVMSLELLASAWGKCYETTVKGHDTCVLFDFPVRDESFGVYADERHSLLLVTLLINAARAEGLDAVLAVKCNASVFGTPAGETPLCVTDNNRVAVLLCMPSNDRPVGYARTDNNTYWRVIADTDEGRPAWLPKPSVRDE
jgi:hypothetical protein